YVFVDERARLTYPDWAHVADEQASQLRAARARWGDEPRFVQLVAELSPMPEFASRWETHLVGAPHSGVKRLVHPRVGELRVAFEALSLADDDQLLVTWLPADPATAAAISTAIDRPEPVSPAHLRVVGDG